jgi:hypothetical protein
VKIPLNWLFFLTGRKVIFFAAPLYVISAILLAVGAMTIFLKLKQKDSNSILKISYVFVIAWCLLPALILWAVDTVEGHKVIEVPRYVIGISPAIYLLAGIGLAYLARKRIRLAIGLILLQAAFAFLNNAYAHVIPQREPWRDMAHEIENRCGKDDLVFVSQFYNVVCLDRYLDRPVRTIGISPALGAEQVRALIASFPVSHFWLLTAQEGESIKEMMPQQFHMAKQIDMMHGLHLRMYER